MRLPRFRPQALLIAVAVVAGAIWYEIRTRRDALQKQANIARTSLRAPGGSLTPADRAEAGKIIADSDRAASRPGSASRPTHHPRSNPRGGGRKNWRPLGSDRGPGG